MTSSLHLMIDPTTLSAARAVSAAARSAPLLVVTHHAFTDLAHELGGDEQAARHLARVATNTGRPIAANLPTGEGSTTVFIAPKGWTPERLRGWVAGKHVELEAMF